MKSVILYFSLFLSYLPVVFGQNLQEIQKLQDEYKKVLERQSLQKPSDVYEAEKTAISTALPDKLIYSRKDIESLLVNTEKLLECLSPCCSGSAYQEDRSNRAYTSITEYQPVPVRPVLATLRER